MGHRRAEVVIIGAGIAGTAAAYHLAARRGVRNVVIVDDRDPLTLTSDKGTQGYRNWWPGPDATMLHFVSRSIDIMEEIARQSGNAIAMSRRGYLFVTARDEEVDNLRRTAATVASYGMGPLRIHPGSAPYLPAAAAGFEECADGADLLDGDVALRAFPYIAPSVRGALHVRRAGWVNAVALGSWSLTRAVAAGAEFVRDRVTGVRTANGAVQGVRLASGLEIATERVVICAGPMLAEVGRAIGITVPVAHELHAKLTFRDTARVVPREAPFLIWNDPVRLRWTEAERMALARSGRGDRFLAGLPGGVHLRPVDGPHGDEHFLIWTFETEQRELVWPPEFNPHYAAVLIRGAAEMLPAMARYARAEVLGFVDGGYYCKTSDNRPLVGPLAVRGSYVCGALSGYGVMAAHGAADLVAAHVTGAPLPDYSAALLPARYDDPSYAERVRLADALVGQL